MQLRLLLGSQLRIPLRMQLRNPLRMQLRTTLHVQLRLSLVGQLRIPPRQDRRRRHHHRGLGMHRQGRRGRVAGAGAAVTTFVLAYKFILCGGLTGHADEVEAHQVISVSSERM